MSTVIQVEQLSKYYRLGLIGGGTLREDLNRWWANVRGQSNPSIKIGEDGYSSPNAGEIWALRNVDFEVKEGDVLGVIGRNGAGKSTLLKILSRITAPTVGQVKIKGRMGSLLEVGTGFHPELTGRENIFLNGAILGMKKIEVDRKLDEIIDFAEIEKFIDTPVKRYSSGMYVRLAFSVAAHLEPDILLVDEVLAVGDIQFQEKCLGKMDDVSKKGRTILFVSHNMSSMKRLCNSGLLLNTGSVQYVGGIDEAIHLYMQRPHSMENTLPLGNDLFLLTNFEVKDQGPVGTHEPINVCIGFIINRPTRGLRIGFDLLDASGGLVFRTNHDDMQKTPISLKEGDYVLHATIPPNLLKQGRYFVSIQAAIHNTCMILDGDIQLPIDLVLTEGVNAAYGGTPIGQIMPAIDWTLAKTLFAPQE